MEVATKGTSVYLPHKTIHLLPAELVEQLAFKPKKKRLSFSAFFEIDVNGEVYSSKF
jgi:exoribonuclease R